MCGSPSRAAESIPASRGAALAAGGAGGPCSAESVMTPSLSPADKGCHGEPAAGQGGREQQQRVLSWVCGGGRNGPAAPGHRGAALHPAEDGSSSMRAVKPKQEAVSQPCLSSSEDDSLRDPDAGPCSGTWCPYPCSWAPIPSGCHQARGLTNYRQSASSAGKGSFLPRPYTRGLFSSSSVSESAAGGSVSDAGPRDARAHTTPGSLWSPDSGTVFKEKIAHRDPSRGQGRAGARLVGRSSCRQPPLPSEAEKREHEAQGRSCRGLGSAAALRAKSLLLHEAA